MENDFSKVWEEIEKRRNVSSKKRQETKKNNENKRKEKNAKITNIANDYAQKLLIDFSENKVIRWTILFSTMYRELYAHGMTFTEKEEHPHYVWDQALERKMKKELSPFGLTVICHEAVKDLNSKKRTIIGLEVRIEKHKNK